jgi:hypothetical protein
MTSTSLGLRNPVPQQSLLALSVSEQAPTAAVRIGNGEEGFEAQRVKNFSGQRKFQAPRADDFAKGMLPHGQACTSDPKPSKPLGDTVDSMINRVKAFWEQHKPGASMPPENRKPD